ncbi:hypothetical protein GCM10011583_66980 [Streptomyces camponoticapitis]|uniref:Uncharacterized protein n=1 Tax=Streptomyces camponoticapitis TaxID=1616125 RepID=A0ABQ2EXG1_9ACTN|nr:DUF6233 domain-containing protein [Streptomyces camponoticapitis]GGK25595.1 hypothetical protein GCM10011583_66980 [Streptomyces camponoticapitis]
MRFARNRSCARSTSLGPTDSPQGWIGERLRAAPGDPDGIVRGVRFHLLGCWAIQGRTGGLTTAQARQMVQTDPNAHAYGVCGAHKALADGE